MPNNPNNNTFATATEILTVSAGTVIKKGELSATADTVDIYKFTTASASNINISLTDLTGNAKVRLGKLNSSGALVEELPASNNGGQLSESLIKTGIAAGTYYIEVTLSGTAPTANYTLSSFASADTSYSSLLWRNETLQGTSTGPAGVAATWQLQGKDYGDARFLPGGTDANGQPVLDIPLPPNLYIAGTGDLNGDGADDIIWRDRNDGSVFTWMMDGKTILKKADGSYDADIIKIANPDPTQPPIVLPIPGNWILAGVADMDGDQKSDLLWRNLSDGTTFVWRMDGTKIASTKQIDAALTVSSDWEVAGLADTNKDSKSDILWRQKSTGIVAIWLLDANTASGIAAVSRAQQVTAPIDLNYKIVAFTDMTGDGKADLVWRNATGGKVAFWEIDGADIATLPGGGYTAATREVAFNVPADYFIAGVADFDGDKKGDLLWRNNNNGFVGVWLTDLTSSTGFKLQREFAVLNATTSVEDTVSPDGRYTIEAVKDFNGDGRADIFWRNISLGETGVWTIKSFPTAANGKILLDLTQTGFIPIGAGADYSIKGVLNTKFTRQPQTLTTGDVKTAFNLGIADGTGNYLESVSGTSKDLYKFKLERTSTVTLALLNPSNLTQPQGGVTRVLRKEGLNGVFEDVTFTDGNRLLAGVYQLEVASAGGTAVVPYNLRVIGTPIAIDLVGKVFTPPANVDLVAVPDPNAATKPKSQISVNYTIENKEPSDSGAVKVRFYISRDENIEPTADKLLKVVNGTTFLDETVVTNVPGNDPNGIAGTVTLELPDGTDLFWLNDRNYYIGMVIDPVSATFPTGEIEETGERDVNNLPIPNAISNNYNQALGKDKQVIGITNTQVPNLQVLQLASANTTLTRTSSSSFTYSVRNDGKRSTQGIAAVTLELWISDQADLTVDNLRTQGARVFLDDVNSGNAINGLTTLSGQSGTFNLTSVNANYWAARPAVTQYYLYAFVDPGTSIGESDEGDNVLKAVSPLTITA
jgi:Bacterial pre-peptidase C-terminal domain/CARDB